MKRLPRIPKTWKELEKLKEFLTDCDISLLRLSENEKFYYLYRNLVPNDLVLEIIKRQIGDKSIALVPNNFPYDKVLKYLPKVKHYCLWSLKRKLTDEEINKYIKKDFPKSEWIYFERKMGHKSVPEIWHCHVFIKNRQ